MSEMSDEEIKEDGAEQAEELEPGPTASEPEKPEKPEKPQKASKKNVDYADPRRPLLWKEWSIGVRCTEEEKTELVRGLATRMKKEGLKEAFAVRADCVVFACMTMDEGLVVYDCKAARKAVV